MAPPALRSGRGRGSSNLASPSSRGRSPPSSPEQCWTWVTHSPGATTAASHELKAIDGETTRVEQRIEQTGILGAVVGRLTRRLTRRYLAMEAAGLKELAEGRVTTS